MSFADAPPCSLIFRKIKGVLFISVGQYQEGERSAETQPSNCFCIAYRKGEKEIKEEEEEEQKKKGRLINRNRHRQVTHAVTVSLGAKEISRAQQFPTISARGIVLSRLAAS